MAHSAIQAHELSKRYQLGQRRDLSTTLAEALSSWRQRRSHGGDVFLWALREVSFEVSEGEILGIVGRNGAGKSTLLKILARITDPTSGNARVRGRVGALLEIGTSFHPELTGRENIGINGALLGMTRQDIRRHFDDIVEFAGVGRFLDTPIKRYSSGMYLRLAFAVAAHLEPDVVVVDEVLAVGDAEFQKRCLGKMSELGGEGRTVLFVSHDLGAIGQLCERVMWLDDGSIRRDGPATDVIREYLTHTVAAGTAVELTDPTDHVAAVVTQVTLTDDAAHPIDPVTRGDPITVRMRIDTRERLQSLEVAVWVTNDEGLRVLDEGLLDVPSLAGALDEPGTHNVVLALPAILPAGNFLLGVWLGSEAGLIIEREVLRFTVLPRVGDRDEMGRRKRMASPAVTWTVDGRGA